MKKVLLFECFVLLFALASRAQSDGLLFNENFPYSSGNLGGQGGWVSGAGTGDVTVTSLTNNTGALIYPGYSSGTSYVSTDNSDQKDPYKTFIGSQTVSTSNATTFFISFVVRVPGGGSNTSYSGFADPSVALRTTAGNNLANFYVADDGNLGTQHLKFGLSKTGGTGTYASTSLSYNTTYLILIRYDIVPGSNNDKLYMWINPSLAVEPTTASANLSITSGTDGSAGTINSLQLLQDDFFNGTTANFDAFKVAYATGYTGSPANDVVAWNDLSPAGAPLPVKFGELKGIQVTNGIELDWSSYAELETDHYDIERSADGQSFEKIGQVAAQGNSERKLDYSFTDHSPLAAANYYRVKCVDIDGGVTYSSVIKISLAEVAKQSLNIYPNPVKGSNLTMQLTNFEPGNYTVRIFDRIGQQVSQLEMIISGQGVTQSLVLPAGIKAGTYNLVISNETSRATRSFIVQ